MLVGRQSAAFESLDALWQSYDDKFWRHFDGNEIVMGVGKGRKEGQGKSRLSGNIRLAQAHSGGTGPQGAWEEAASRDGGCGDAGPRQRRRMD